MNIVVCMKQVPASSNIAIDPATGTLVRTSGGVRTNPYDLFALETALQIKERMGGIVTAITMGPQQAETMMRDAYAMGADRAVVLSDRKFAGADVLATSFTLSQGIRALGMPDLIICGRQTTDGDTAQVGPAIAEHLNLPHAAWVSQVLEVTEERIVVRQELGSVTQVSAMAYPCLITMDKDSCVPRLPSYRQRQKTKGRSVEFMGLADLPDQNLSRYGLVGSPTAVVRTFAPEAARRGVHLQGDAQTKAQALIDALVAEKTL